MSNLLTESSDNLITESGKNITLDEYQVCDWPTVEDVKEYLGITEQYEDAYIQGQINACVAVIEGYLGRKIPMAVDTQTFRLTDCDKAFHFYSRLSLHRYPVTEITETTPPNIEMKLDENGMLCANFQQYSEVTIKYHGGICPIPSSLLDVFYNMMSVRYSLKGYQVPLSGSIKKVAIPGVMSEENFDSGTSVTTSGFGLASPDNFTYALDPYKAWYC